MQKHHTVLQGLSKDRAKSTLPRELAVQQPRLAYPMLHKTMLRNCCIAVVMPLSALAPATRGQGAHGARSTAALSYRFHDQQSAPRPISWSSHTRWQSCTSLC